MKTLLTSAAIILATSGFASAATIEIAAWDTNADGFVDSSEYNAGMAAENVEVIAMSLEEIQDWIRINNPEVVVTGVDNDSDGELERSEIAIEGDAVAVATDEGAMLTQDEVGPDFMAFDVDRDGRLNPAEFANWQDFGVKIGIFLDQ